MISVSVDDAGDRAKVVAWLKELKPGFPIVLDDQGKATSKPFRIDQGLPYNVVIDRSGKVTGTNSGNIEELKKLVAKAVGGASPAARKRAGR